MNTIPSEQQLQSYLKEKKVEQILTALLEAICFHRPDDVPKFIVSYVNKHYSQVQHHHSAHGPSQHQQQQQHQQDKSNNDNDHEPRNKHAQAFSFLGEDNVEDPDDDDFDNGDKEGGIDMQTSENIRRRYSVSFDRRGAVSNESIDVTEANNFTRVKVPKTPEERQRLEEACSKITLFKYLDDEEANKVYDSMFEKKFTAGEIIIKQGSEGDNFYVVDSGECEIIKEEGPNKTIHLKYAASGDSFGELALIFGTPRAATVVAKTDVKLWAIDRISYRTILMKETIRKRQMYEDFLKQCAILSNLTSYERDTIADALISETFQPGSVIVKQGEPGDSFFIIVDGEVACIKETPQGESVLGTLKKSDYFGELALLYDQPRACTVKAMSLVKIVKLNRQSFKQLLGPIEQILKRNMEQYNKYMSQKM